ncbi:hypothetical protein P7K49_012891, partial [Saguinus oedipus]
TDQRRGRNGPSLPAEQASGSRWVTFPAPTDQNAPDRTQRYACCFLKNNGKIT